MKATISLKQLRSDPREYIRLLTSGYDVEITEHRRTLISASRTPESGKPRPGDALEILRVIRSLPKLETPFPEMDTIELIKKTRLEGFEEKRRRIDE